MSRLTVERKHEKKKKNYEYCSEMSNKSGSNTIKLNLLRETVTARPSVRKFINF